MMWMLASAGLVATAGAGVATRSSSKTLPTVTTVAVTRGDLVQATSATGSLEAVTTVNVGSRSPAPFDAMRRLQHIVRKGQTLARLDPSLFRARLEQAGAN
jgi:HlyD family secretion protein